jgi:N-sulfoglucosamine sulfohydrolase
MKKTNILLGASLLSCATGVYAAENERPNILLITVDDMNYNSVGVFGSPVKGITPNIDRLASEGMLFRYGFVQAGASQPSRNVLATGLYGHNSGVEGFNFIPEDSPVVTSFDILRDAGYYTGAMAKLSHCFPKRSDVGKLDMSVTAEQLVTGRDPAKYYKYCTEFFDRVKESGKPFFLMANSQDPHRPFWGSKEEQNRRNTGQTIYGNNPVPYPSRIITEEDITEVPGFVPDLPDVRTELTQYYNNVRRADDTVGEILRALSESGMEDNTIVVFLSDNGMSMPFAKTNCYVNSNKTPLIIKWPGIVTPGRIEEVAMVGAVDFLPTILDITSLEAPYVLDGVSYKELLYGKKWRGPKYVYTHFAWNSGQNAEPMRCIQNRDFAYIFSPWSDQERVFKSETTSGLTFRAMQQAALTDQYIAGRVHFFEHRTIEEFYDLRNDPDALVNLIDDPAYAGEVKKFRRAMEKKMVETGDPILSAFRGRHDPEILKSYMEAQQVKADTYKKHR